MKIKQNKRQQNKLKKFFNNNAVRAAIVFFLVFMAIPFFFTEPQREVEEEDQFSSAPVVISQNPLSKIFDRVARFYGIKKSAGTSARNAADLSGLGADIYGPGGSLQASARRGADASAKGGAAAKGGQGGFASYASEGQGSIPSRSHQAEAVQEFVRMNGKTYEVKTDASGKKVVLMEDGPVSFNKLMAQTVSREDFRAAKKAAPHLQGWQIAEAIHYAQQNNWPGGAPAFLKSDEYRRFTESGANSLFADAGGAGGWGSGGVSGAAAGSAGTSGGSEGGRYSGGGASTFGGKLAAAKAAESKAAAASLPKAGIVPSAVAAEVLSTALAKQVIGDMEPGYKLEPPKALQLNMLEEGVARDQSVVDLKDKGSTDNFIPQSKEMRERMTSALLGDGEAFVGYYNIETKDENGIVKNIPMEEKDPWMFPKLTKEKALTPAAAFYDENSARLRYSKKEDPELGPYRLRSTWEKVDKHLVDTMEEMYKDQQPNAPVRLLVRDGGTNKENSYHYQVARIALSGAPDKVKVEDAVVDRDGNVDPKYHAYPITFDKKTAADIKAGGAPAALWEGGISGPREMWDFFDSIKKNMSDYANNVNRPQVNTDRENISGQHKNNLAEKLQPLKGAVSFSN